MDSVARRLVASLDPRLEKYREKKPVPEWTPEKIEELVNLIQRTPSEVLDSHQKRLIARALSFEEKRVCDIMLPRDEVVLVMDSEFLGPLKLDELYKSGFSHFPVIDTNRHILGLLHTEALNSLEVTDNMLARDYVDKNVVYVRGDYLLTEAIAAMVRNDRDYLIVIDEFERLIDLITMPMILRAMLGYIPQDDFKQDNSAAAVAKRIFA